MFSDCYNTSGCYILWELTSRLMLSEGIAWSFTPCPSDGYRVWMQQVLWWLELLVPNQIS